VLPVAKLPSREPRGAAEAGPRVPAVGPAHGSDPISHPGAARRPLAPLGCSLSLAVRETFGGLCFPFGFRQRKAASAVPAKAYW
jgi:hypothetical protein